MWPFTSHGFDSLPRSRSEPDKTPVRARTRRDLANLQTRTGNPAPISKTLHADDRWRILITPSESERIRQSHRARGVLLMTLGEPRLMFVSPITKAKLKPVIPFGAGAMGSRSCTFDDLLAASQ
jgi:hypothetical protein